MNDEAWLMSYWCYGILTQLFDTQRLRVGGTIAIVCCGIALYDKADMRKPFSVPCSFYREY